MDTLSSQVGGLSITTPTKQHNNTSGDELSLVVGSLADSLSTVILSAITESFADVQSALISLAGSTNKIASIVQVHWLHCRVGSIV